MHCDIYGKFKYQLSGIVGRFTSQTFACVDGFPENKKTAETAIFVCGDKIKHRTQTYARALSFAVNWLFFLAALFL